MNTFFFQTVLKDSCFSFLTTWNLLRVKIVLLFFILYPNNDSALCHALTFTNSSFRRSIVPLPATKSSEWQQEYQHDVDEIQQGLCSPAPESYRVIQKAVHQLNSSLEKEEEDVNYFITNVYSLSYLIKRDYQLQLLSQQSYTKVRKRYSWNVIQKSALAKNSTHDHSIVRVISPTCYANHLGVQNVLELSRKALEIATAKDFMNCESKNDELEDVVNLAIVRLTAF